jgi:hypothetical protein
MKKTNAVFILLITYICSSGQMLYPVEIKSKWGYMNPSGKMVIEAMYDYAAEFNNGYAMVALNNQPCLINASNKRLIDTGLYQYISAYSEGLCVVRDFKNNKFYVDTNNRVHITLPQEVYEARPFKNGRACISKSMEHHFTKFGRDIATIVYHFGYIDKSGHETIACTFDDADDFNATTTRIKKDGKFGLIDTSGQYLLQPSYTSIGSLSDQLYAVCINGKYGYADVKGKMVIEPQYEFAYDFSEGKAAFFKNSLIGFINTGGQVIIPAQYNRVRPFAEGKAAVMKDGKWGFINSNGEWVIRNVFDDAAIFSEGLCAVLIKKKWGYIDAQGLVKIPADFDAAGSFNKNIADVVYHNYSFYINKNGTLLPLMGK